MTGSMSRPTGRLVLASRSAIRAEILRGAGLAFDVVDAGVDEAPIKAGLLRRGAAPAEIARVLAEEKAKAASEHHDGLVIGADQTLDLNGRLFDKPSNPEGLKAQLLELRGNAHQLHSGVALGRAGALVATFVDSATLTMRRFSDAFLEGYVARNQTAALACVGGYQLEGEGVQLFESLSGDYFTILGLPLLPLLDALRREGALAK